ncbi:MAG: hypothetical protein QX197_13250 [Methylococcaceae bacterium]
MNGELTIDAIRVSPENTPASCYSAKLIADDKTNPSLFQVANLESKGDGECLADAVYAPESGFVHVPIVNIVRTGQESERYQVDLQVNAIGHVAIQQVRLLSAYQPPRMDYFSKVTTVDPFFYVFGKTIYRYNLVTHNWKNIGKLLPPQGLGGEAIPLEHSIYLLGYTLVDYASFSYNDNQRFLTLDNTIDYFAVAPAPPPISAINGYAAVAFNNNIYLLGGSYHYPTTHIYSNFDTTWIYHPNTDTWQRGVPLPSARSGGAAAVLNNTLYYSGGINFSNYPTIEFDQLLRFIPEEQRWETLAPLPEPMFSHQMLINQGELVVLVNKEASQLSNGTYIPILVSKSWIYNPDKNSWRDANVPIAELGVGTIFQVVNDEWYAVKREALAAYATTTIYTIWHYNKIGMYWENLTTNAAAKPSAAIHYQGHVQDVGWMPWQQNGATIGQIDAAERLEAVRIVLADLPQCSVHYRAKLKDRGWTTWVSDGISVGTVGLSQPLYNFQVMLDSDRCENLTVKYRVYLHNQGWQVWVDANKTTINHNAYAVFDEQSQKVIEGMELLLEEQTSDIPMS